MEKNDIYDENSKTNNDNVEISEMLQGNVERGLKFYKKDDKVKSSQDGNKEEKNENAEERKIDKKKISYRNIAAIAGVGLVLFGTKGLIDKKVEEKTNRNNAIRNYVEQLDEMYEVENENIENSEICINTNDSYENDKVDEFSKEDLADLRRFYAAIDIYTNSDGADLENINNKLQAEAVIVNYVKEGKLLNTSKAMVTSKIKDAIVYGKINNVGIVKDSKITVEYRENVEEKKKYVEIVDIDKIIEIDSKVSQTIPRNLENLIIDIYELKDSKQGKEKWIKQAIHIAEDLAVVAEENYIFDKKGKIDKISKKEYKKIASSNKNVEPKETKQTVQFLNNVLER
ncbi:MAG: hypothetical protein E7313_05940 [Clostridiales bacterium]|nr:hypothetical protein [Clostridiales bacterium]